MNGSVISFKLVLIKYWYWYILLCKFNGSSILKSLELYKRIIYTKTNVILQQWHPQRLWSYHSLEPTQGRFVGRIRAGWGLREGWGNYLTCLKRGWNREEQRGNKDFENDGGMLGQGVGILKEKGGGGGGTTLQTMSYSKVC